MIDALISVYKVNPSDSWRQILTYKNEKHLKEFVEQLGNCEDVVKVEVIPVPDPPYKTYNEYIKEHFNAE